MLRSLLLSLVLAIPSTAAELVAPAPVLLGPAPMPDTDPASASNGTTTLVAWVNEYSPYASTWSTYVRTLENPASGWRLTGFNPILATNGNDYLLAFSMAGSRFMSYPFDNVSVQLVSAAGEPGASRVLNRSPAGFAGDVRASVARVADEPMLAVPRGPARTTEARPRGRALEEELEKLGPGLAREEGGSSFQWCDTISRASFELEGRIARR